MADIKKGDKVRATLGNSIIEGIVTYVTVIYLDVQVAEEDNDSISLFRDTWDIQVTNPPVKAPTGKYAVVNIIDPDKMYLTGNDEPFGIWISSGFGWTAPWRVKNSRGSDIQMGIWLNEYEHEIIFEGKE